ncbi:MAG: 30S ribosomal protein S12 methylthiotransferase RimO [Deltaproteobacteria bacterium]|nr:30S ribosomal protein S12 methylthiotransferase RimO [Deltaproteobacteria bacterium]MBW1912389.1 30S ribosomal protein S12 methylthiotransferase RimO [Deltaproteobacteria bacterium]
MNSTKKKIFLISLGCAKNLVDSENMLGLLREKDFIIVSSLEEADIAIINTCGFIQSAVEECIDTIFEVAARKRQGDLEALYVVGCFVQRYGYKLRKEIPEVDGWLGQGELNRITDLMDESGASPSFLISRPTFLADHTMPRIQTTPFYSAYIKIADGCSHRCSFCTIPALRGTLRSRDPESVAIEAREMAERGVKEINLIAQDTTAYGTDLEIDIRLEDLIEKLLIIKGLRWIRVLYAHPFGVSHRLLELMEGEEGICPYLEMPFQHVNENILRAMGRSFSEEEPLELIRRIRSLNRRVSLRTTLMVGFPGETEDIFRELYDFVERAEFDHLGVFVFSPEKGTRAARMHGAPEREAGEERLDAIMSLQAEISMRRNRQLVNQVLPVLIEGESRETELLLSGRTASMAPDVDGQVLINKGQGIVGEITPVLIREAHSYDLIGEIV